MTAIIAILASVLLPTLNVAKQKGQSAVCLSNERQLQVVYQSWLQDGQQRLDELEIFENWLAEMGKGGSAWICPSAPARIPEQPLQTFSSWSSNGEAAGNPETSPEDMTGVDVGIARMHIGSDRRGWQISSLGMGIGQPDRYYAYATNRVGSYAINWYLLDASWFGHEPDQPPITDLHPKDFITESDVEQPSLTPVLADAVSWRVSPTAADRLLFVGVINAGRWDMSHVAIPRHGSRPKSWPPEVPAVPDLVNKPKLPGAVNIVFFDGHATSVKLERLWELTWHRGYGAASAQHPPF